MVLKVKINRLIEVVLLGDKNQVNEVAGLTMTPISKGNIYVSTLLT